MLKRVKTNPYALMIWVLFSNVLHIVLFKAKVNFDYPVWQRLLVTIVIACFTLLLHESTHFIFVKIVSKRDAKIRFAKDPLGLPSMGVFFCQDELSKWQRIVIYLAPFILLTVLVDSVFIFCIDIEFLFFIIPVCNSAGCFYDILDALIVAKED